MVHFTFSNLPRYLAVMVTRRPRRLASVGGRADAVGAETILLVAAGIVVLGVDDRIAQDQGPDERIDGRGLHHDQGDQQPRESVHFLGKLVVNLFSRCKLGY